MTIYAQLHMSSYYLVYPGQENYFHHFSGIKDDVIVKVGIFKGNKDPEDYVHSRYMGGSFVLFSSYEPKIPMEHMKRIEKEVLSDLIDYEGFSLQHGKKEHFVIPATKLARKMFTWSVQALYKHHVSVYFESLTSS